MRKLVAVAVLAAVAAALSVARLSATRAGASRLERARVVLAPPEAVLAELRDLRQWSGWSAWEGDDVRSRVYGGPPSGTGASCYWSDARGEAGRLTVVADRADGLDLELERRGRPPADLEVRLSPAPGGTRVAWTRVVEPDVFARALAFLGLEPSAASLERTLAQLAAQLEARPRVARWSVSRSLSVRAAPAAVLARVADVRAFARWSPWEDPARPTAFSFGGPREGAGASAYWPEAGRPAPGRLTIVRAGARGVELELERRGVSSDHALAVAPADGATRVTWTMSGEAPPGEAPSLATLAAELDRGLARLRAAVDVGDAASRAEPYPGVEARR